ISFPHLAPEGRKGELALATNGDQSGGFEFLEVVRKSRSRDWGALAQFDARARLLSGNVLQDVVAPRIGDGLGDGAKLCACQGCGCAARLTCFHDSLNRCSAFWCKRQFPS